MHTQPSCARAQAALLGVLHRNSIQSCPALLALLVVLRRMKRPSVLTITAPLGSDFIFTCACQLEDKLWVNNNSRLITHRVSRLPLLICSIYSTVSQSMLIIPLSKVCLMYLMRQSARDSAGLYVDQSGRSFRLSSLHFIKYKDTRWIQKVQCFFLAPFRVMILSVVNTYATSYVEQLPAVKI